MYVHVCTVSYTHAHHTSVHTRTPHHTMRTRTHTHTHTHTHTRTHTHTHTHTRTHTRTHTYTHTHVHTLLAVKYSDTATLLDVRQRTDYNVHVYTTTQCTMPLQCVPCLTIQLHSQTTRLTAVTVNSLGSNYSRDMWDLKESFQTTRLNPSHIN